MSCLCSLCMWICICTCAHRTLNMGCLCVCVCVLIPVLAHIYMWILACGSQRSTSGSVPGEPWTSLFEVGSLIGLELTKQARLDSPLCTSPTLGLNLGPYGYEAGTLLSQPFSQLRMSSWQSFKYAHGILVASYKNYVIDYIPGTCPSSKIGASFPLIDTPIIPSSISTNHDSLSSLLLCVVAS